MVKPQLTVHTAVLQTATVQIKTLTISGRQVTLAVFRQLVEEPCIAPSGAFAGAPWGTVNYHPSNHCLHHGGEHHHVVWQKGDELRRGTVYKPHRDPGCLVQADLAERWSSALVQHGWRPSAPLSYDDQYIRIRFPSGPVDVRLSDYAHDALRCCASMRCSRFTIDCTEHYAEQRDKIIRSAPEPVDVETCRAYEAEIDAEAHRVHVLLPQRWAEIEQLPQLFIAV